MRMRDLGSKCNVVEIYVRDNELSGFTRRRKLDNPTNVSIEIARIAFDLFKRNYSWPKPLRGIGVRGADLSRGHPAPAIRLPQCTAAGRVHRPRFGRHQRLRRP